MKSVRADLREFKMIDKNKIHGAVKNCAGQRFGGVVAIKIIGKGSNGTIWQCKCDCGLIVNRTRKSFVDNERLGQVTRCSRKCPAKYKKTEPKKILKLNMVMR